MQIIFNILVTISLLLLAFGCGTAKTSGYLEMDRMFDSSLNDPATGRKIGHQAQVYIETDILPNSNWDIGPFVDIKTNLGEEIIRGHFVPLSADMGGGLRVRKDNWELRIKGGSVHGFDRFSIPESYNFYGVRYNF